MKLITVTAIRSIKVKPYFASQGEEMLVDLAIGSYGYLLRCQPPREYTFSEFADIIATHYDVLDGSRNFAVVEALRAVQEQTEKLKSVREVRVSLDQTCRACEEVFDANDPEIESTWQQVQCPCCGSWEERQKQSDMRAGGTLQSA
ncbi:hypothetical protein AB4Y45_33860 [Paraburkholderia sp. EG287A]|uniref:hypothetical protein n=1 Tax=Paraburkholderia sp. EG287A TaxID=3237012 RepID=UPI0034D3052F